jgi:hypothetical protein
MRTHALLAADAAMTAALPDRADALAAQAGTPRDGSWSPRVATDARGVPRVPAPRSQTPIR